MTRLSIFDLDETITRRPTFLRWVLFWVRREAPWRAPLLLLAVPAAALWAAGLVSRANLKSFAARLAMGRSVSREVVRACAAAFAENELRENVLLAALERIAAEKAQGRSLVLASASFEAYVEAFGERLGAVGAVGTRMPELEGGRLRPVVYGGNVYAEAKLARVEDWLGATGLARGDCHVRFFSDHISDAPMLGWADEGVVVNPLPALAAMAGERGWTVERWS